MVSVVAEKKEKQYICDNAQLMAEWDWETNHAKGFDPSRITCGSTKLVFWICPKCNMSYPARIPDRIGKNCGCSYCAGKRPILGVNDLETWCKSNAREDLLEEWKPELNNGKTPAEFTFASNKKINWECNHCGNQWPQQIDQRTLRNFGCRKCRVTGTSFPERFLFLCLDAIIGNVQNGHRDFGFEIDIYLESLNIAIEYDGEYYHKTIDRRKADAIKNKKCASQGVHLLRIRENRDGEESIAVDGDVVYWRYSREKNNLQPLLCTILEVINAATQSDYNTDNIDIDALYQSAIRTTYGVRPEKSLAFKFPESAAEWDYERNGDIRPSDVSSGSHDTFSWICAKCGHQWFSKVNDRTQGGGCAPCAIKANARLQHEKAIAQNNLTEWCMENASALLEEWDYEKNTRPPEDYSVSSNDLVWWICKACGHNWEAQVYARTKLKSGCKECWNHRRRTMHRNDKVVEGENSFTTWCMRNKREDLLEQWDYQKNEFPPENYTYGSKRGVWWKCANGHEWMAQIKSRTTQGNGCKRCRYLKDK